MKLETKQERIEYWEKAVKDWEEHIIFWCERITQTKSYINYAFDLNSAIEERKKCLKDLENAYNMEERG